MLARALLCALGALCAAASELRVLQGARSTTLYVAIAAPPSAASALQAFNSSLEHAARVYLRDNNPHHLQNITLQPLFIELPENERFSNAIIEKVCGTLSNRRVAALIVCGGGDAATAVVSVASRAGVPVIRTTPSHLHFSYTLANEILPMEIRLEVTARETLHALRALLLHTHWHSFTVLAEEDVFSTLSLRKEYSSILSAPPLNPKWLSLPSKYTRHSLFRRLAEISRLTRGVVILFTDLNYTSLVMEEAKRLNLLDGHFFWLWVDTTRVINVFDSFKSRSPSFDDDDFLNINLRPKYSKKNNESSDNLRNKHFLMKDIKIESEDEVHKKSINKDNRVNEADNVNINAKVKSVKNSKNNSKHNLNVGLDSESYDSINYFINKTVHNLYDNFKNSNNTKIENNIDEHSFENRDVEDKVKNNFSHLGKSFDNLPVGLLALHPQPIVVDADFIEATVLLTIGSLVDVLRACDTWSVQAQFFSDASASCWQEPSDIAADFSAEFVRIMRIAAANALSGGAKSGKTTLTASFALLNLVPTEVENKNSWKQVGHILGRDVNLHTIIWPGGRLVAHGQSAGARTIFRIVTSLAPPFVMEGELDEDGQCLRGLPCHRPQSSDRDNLTLAFNELEREIDQDTDNFFFPTPNPTSFSRMPTHCCYGLAMDLLENIAEELEFDFHLYIVGDGLFGARRLLKSFRRIRDYKAYANDYQTSNLFDGFRYRNGFPSEETTTGDYMDNENNEDDEKWNGVMGDLVSGAAHMSFAALSVSAARAEVIDFSQPYFFSSVSILAAPKQKADIPLLAFLLPFSPELWIAIFTSLNVTALAVAIYEWLSPFGLNPWGRQRSKNFSISSALWVMWGLLCGHLVAFKAPKSWPNKFLINVWGGFSVIFVASYTANIAALIAGLFFHNAVDDFQGRSNWLSLKIGTAQSSIAEYYVQRNNPQLAQQMRRYAFDNVEEGIQRLRNGTLDLLIADTPVLDYYRATDHGCKLQKVGDHPLAEDTYAIGMAKGFPLKDSISAVIAKYSSNGYMDILTEKWYGGLPCFKLSKDYGVQPKPLGVAAVAGVFILLGVGMVVGCLILIFEHLFYKYTLPVLRHQPKGSVWRSRNIMFFSQKLYRFINCVELVSPHHAARELVHTIRQGHFTSLFQKSVKRKEHEQRRRRRSKAQFFEIIQDIRRQQSRDRSLDSIKENNAETLGSSEKISESKFLAPLPDVSKLSPRSRSPRTKRKKYGLGSINIRRFSTDSVLESDSSSFYERTSMNIGRRLSKDTSFLTSSPPDINTRLRTPSPMKREESKSNQDLTENDRTHRSQDSRTSIEILVSQDTDTVPCTMASSFESRPTLSSRVSEEELIRLWRSVDHDVQDSFMFALKNRLKDYDVQDPG